MKDLPIIKFQEGLNQKPDPELGGFQTLENIDLSETGIAKSIKDDAPYWELPPVYIGSSRSTINSIGREGVGTTTAIFVNSNDYLYKDGSVIAPSSNIWIEFSSQSGRTYYTGEGTGCLLYYSASGGIGGYNIWFAGAPVPTSACTAAAGAATGFTGTYTIVVTYYNENGFDGNPSAAATVSGLTDDKIDLTNIPTYGGPSHSVTGRKVWIKGGTTPLYSDYVLLGTITDNTTTSLSGRDTTHVDPTTILDTDNNIAPANCKYLINHYDTFFLAGDVNNPNTLYFSKAGKGEQWPTAQAFKISRSGDPITAIFSWNGVLWVSTYSKIYQIIGSPGLGDLIYNFYPKESMATKGSLSFRGVVSTPYGAFYEADDNIYRFNGVNSENFGDEIQDILDDRNTDARVTCSAFWDNKMLFSMATGSATRPNVTVQYDFDLKKWTSYNRGYNDFVVDRSNNVLYAASDYYVNIFRGGGSYSSWTIKTKNLSEVMNSYHSWGKVQVDMEGSCTMNLYLDDTLSSTETLSATARQFVTRRFSNQLAHTAAVELVGGTKTSQDKIYSITVSAEPQRGQI